ncbi:MAG: lipopolysaccharide heptosyltransferase II [Mariprofundaceae bacterium]|nr:lipopolysaccharide heptosyltransferase II [Mariprofundaceae bacterium]
MAQPAMHAIAQHQQGSPLKLTGKAWLADLIPFLNLGHVEYHPSCRVGAHEVFIFRNSFSAAWQAFAARIPRRHGFSHDCRGILLRPSYRPNLNMAYDHHRQYFLDLVRQAGIDAPQDSPVHLHAEQHEIDAGHDLMRQHGLVPERVLCVAPGAQFGGAKRYPDLGYRAVLKTLGQAGWQPIVLGMREDAGIGDSCLMACTSLAWNACGETSLRQALQLLAGCRLLLCNDSGLMHVAAGLDRPVVAVFGATAPTRTAPSGGNIQLLYTPAPCSPCLQRECNVAGHPCMANVSTEAVIRACCNMLQQA